MLVLTDVSKSYHGQTRIFENVCFEMKRGDFLYLVGGTGAGKSSLLRTIATEEPPSSGHISLFGYSLSSVSETTLRAIRQSIGYIPQGVRLISDLTVFDNVALSLSLAGSRNLSAEAKAKISDLLSRLGLESKRDHLASTLSGGEAQRVAVARALVRSPQLIVADEPTGAQDRDYTWSVMDLVLKANAAGAAVILATHDREIVRRVRKRCAILRKGHVNLEDAACIY